jgi:hypothetical protein
MAKLSTTTELVHGYSSTLVGKRQQSNKHQRQVRSTVKKQDQIIKNGSVHNQSNIGAAKSPRGAEYGMQVGPIGKEVAAPRGSPNFETGVLNSSDRLLTLLL